MADAKVRTQRRSVAGAFFGGVGRKNQPGSWQGDHDPEIKKNWNNFKAQKSTDQQFVEDQYNQTPIKKIQVQRENTERALRQQYRQTQAGQFADRQMTRSSAALRQYSTNATAQGKKKRASAAKYAAARVKVTAANAWINSWVMFWYLAFQLPMAVVSAAGLGMAYAVYEFVNSKIIEPIEGVFGYDLNGFFLDVASGAGNVVAKITDFIFGISFDPILLFIAPFALVFLFGLFQLILCWFVYSLLGIKSLSGQAGSVKIAMFLVALVGIMIPILNLFPLMLLWTGAVWFKPK